MDISQMVLDFMMAHPNSGVMICVMAVCMVWSALGPDSMSGTSMFARVYNWIMPLVNLIAMNVGKARNDPKSQ